MEKQGKRFGLIGVMGLLVALTTLLLTGQAFAAGTGQLVCLDPGHGGTDPGAVNGSLYEAKINLDVAFRTKALLEGSGYTVTMTREDNSYLTNKDRYTFCNQAGADILVSIHTNSSTNPNVDGTLTLYKKQSDVPLAQALQDRLYPALSGDATWTFTDFGLDVFASGVLLKSQMPAAMVEPVLMSHAGEFALLTDGTGDRQQTIAQAIYDGIDDYFAANSGGGSGGGDGGGGGGGNCPPNSKKPGC